MRTAPVLLSAVAFAVGEIVGIDDLVTTTEHERTLIAALKQRGHRRVSCDRRPAADICRAAAAEALIATAVSPRDIGAVVFADASERWGPTQQQEMFAALTHLGIDRAAVMGITCQGCAGTGAALQVASRLACDGPRPLVLVLVFGKILENASRIEQDGRTIFGDGAAACLVSRQAGDFEIASTMSQTIMPSGVSSDPVSAWREGLAGVQRVLADAYTAASITSSAVRMVFGTNGSLVYLHVLAEAAGVPFDRVYGRDLERVGHVHSCDSLIGLSHFGTETGYRADDYYVLVGWGSQTASATIVRYVGRPQ